MACSHEETGRVQRQELAGCLKSICDILIASIYEWDENDLGLAEVEVALIKPKRKNKTKQNPTGKEGSCGCLPPLTTPICKVEKWKCCLCVRKWPWLDQQPRDLAPVTSWALLCLLRILFACGLAHEGYELPTAGKKESPLILTLQIDWRVGVTRSLWVWGTLGCLSFSSLSVLLDGCISIPCP